MLIDPRFQTVIDSPSAVQDLDTNGAPRPTSRELPLSARGAVL
jgi:hypothetical protein